MLYIECFKVLLSQLLSNSVTSCLVVICRRLFVTLYLFLSPYHIKSVLATLVVCTGICIDLVQACVVSSELAFDSAETTSYFL